MTYHIFNGTIPSNTKTIEFLVLGSDTPKEVYLDSSLGVSVGSVVTIVNNTFVYPSGSLSNIYMPLNTNYKVNFYDSDYNLISVIENYNTTQNLYPSIGIGSRKTDHASFIEGSTSVNGINIMNATYDEKLLAVSAKETVVAGLVWSPDGLNAYIIGTSSDKVNQYKLTTAWDIDTGTFYGESPSLSGKDTSPQCLCISPDGTKLYFVGGATDTIHTYNFATPWDVTTLTDASNSLSITASEGSPTGIFCKPDGTKFFVVGSSSDNIREITLTTPWTISTGSITASKSISSQSGSSSGIFISNDGTLILTCDIGSDDIDIWTLTTPWSVTTATYFNTFSYNTLLTTLDNQIADICLSRSGHKLYVVGRTTSKIYQFSVPVITRDFIGNDFISGNKTIDGDLIIHGSSSLGQQIKANKRITATGTTGARTINTSIGSINFAALATSVVVTNSLVTANSIIIATVATNDATMLSVQIVATTGSFTIYANVAPTAETRVNFMVLN